MNHLLVNLFINISSSPALLSRSCRTIVVPHNLWGVRDTQEFWFHPHISIQVLFVTHGTSALCRHGCNAQHLYCHVVSSESRVDYLSRQWNVWHLEVAIQWVDFPFAVHYWMAVSFHEYVDRCWISNNKNSSWPCNTIAISVWRRNVQSTISTMSYWMSHCLSVQVLHWTFFVLYLLHRT